MQMDRLLAAACAIFPTGEEPVPTARPGQWAEAPSPEGVSGVAAAARRASAGYRDAGARVTALTEALDETVSAAAAQGQQAGAAAAGIRDTARSRAWAIAPSAQSPQGVGLLVSTMDERLATMQNHIAVTRDQLRAAAVRIREHRAELTAVQAGQW